jgi:signal transduction histidine kinase
MTIQNCWEMKKCGREPGGAHVQEFGACPATTEQRVDGVNGGKNGGRTCWAIAGTMCSGTVQGTYAAKMATCQSCEFFKSVQRAIMEADPTRPEQASRILNLVLERTVALEREIGQRQKAEESLRVANTKLNLLSSITRHDMLNKLHSIGLLLELLTRKCSGEGGAGDSLAAIGTQLQSLEEMIWFTSDYQDLGVQAPAWHSVPHVIAGIRGWVQGVPLELDPGLDKYEVYADPLLSKVFYNLADNAVRHGGRVTRIRVFGEEQPGRLVIFWEDDGIGVSLTDKERIFSKGYGKHTGLGLFLVREILSITGISIRETGVPGTGARFEMIVPEGAYRRTGS